MITSNSPSGGLYRDTMNNLTSMTNGFSVYCYDEKFSRTVQSLPTYDYTSLMYAANVRLSTSGYIPIPQMDTYHYYYQWLFMTIQDHGPLDQYQFSNITWYGRGVYNEKDNNNCCYTTKSDVLVRYGNTNIITAAFDFAPGPYDMYVKVQFADNIKELVQIRFYSYKDAIDHWIPYED